MSLRWERVAWSAVALVVVGGATALHRINREANEATQAAGQGLAEVHAARRAAHAADPCVREWEFQSRTAAVATESLARDVTACREAQAMIAQEIASCAIAQPTAPCGEWVRAWHCLHNADCFDEAKAAMQDVLDNVEPVTN